MTQNIILYILFLLTSFSSNAQISALLVTDSISEAPKISNNLYQYYKYANNAKWHYYSKNYKEAILNYKKAFLYNKPQAEHLEDLVECYRATNESDSALKLARFCVESFGYNMQRMAKDTSLSNYYEQLIFRNHLGIFYSKEGLIRDIIMIEHYLHNDHFFRNSFSQFNLNNEKCITNKKEFAFEVALQFDSMYAIPFVLDLLKKYNFPNAYDIGNQSVGYLMFLLRHYNIEKYVLDSALINGKILPEQYASLVDYKFNVDWETLIKEGKLKPKNNFGPNLREIDGRMVVGEIDDIENVDKRRDEIGLMPLWQFAKYKNFELSDAYKKVLDTKKIKYQ